ncbi:hypothetical protein BDF14DRAFT_1716111 [Spinellus fusiger]|nr:hypothetical protein BDF14DRAFT_1716111 [Spinellus fusiger]
MSQQTQKAQPSRHRRHSFWGGHPGDDDPIYHPQDEFKHPLKRTVYLLLEDPSSSDSAFWTNIAVSFLIVFSALTTTIETIPAFRSAESSRVWKCFIYRLNVETAMVLLFSLEYMLRIFAHSDTFAMLARFFLSPISIIDFISIVPFYIELLAQHDTTYEFRFTILRLFRLLRLFKTYKYSSSLVMTLEVMMVALRRSGDALSALFFFLVTSVVLFSTLLYFAERGTWDAALEAFVTSNGDPSDFDSIPAAFWFVVVTITTTGYGDMVPATFIGKLITFPAMMFGVLLIALPSIIVGRNFTVVWEVMRRRQYLAQRAQTSDEEPIESTHVERRPSLVDDAFANMRPLDGGFDLINTNHVAIMEQIQTLAALIQQNQLAIQQIVEMLEQKQAQNSVSDEGPFGI